jgi:hypothetical protein
MTDLLNPDAVAGHNLPPEDPKVEPTPFEALTATINDLFDTAKDFADGQPIADAAMHDTIEKIYTHIHDSGRDLEALRVEEKKPLDDQVKAIQAAYNPFIQKDKGKVDLAKSSLGTLLAAWRKQEADKKAAIAAAARLEAERAADEAQAAIRASSGNLEARVMAEELLAHSKSVAKDANRADRAATTGLGLRTVWRSECIDVEAALDHYYPLVPNTFLQLVEEQARVDVSLGKREIPGFRIWDEQRATV